MTPKKCYQRELYSEQYIYVRAINTLVEVYYAMSYLLYEDVGASIRHLRQG